ncbi:hypothetical protein BDW60DRAFT_64361 [Aspergillus nidulans var. acristatus]|jgi:hypothetical protein
METKQLGAPFVTLAALNLVVINGTTRLLRAAGHPPLPAPVTDAHPQRSQRPQRPHHSSVGGPVGWRAPAIICTSNITLLSFSVEERRWHRLIANPALY